MNINEHKISICIASYGDDVGPLLLELRHCVDFGLPDLWSTDVLISDQFYKRHKNADSWEQTFGCRYIHTPHTKGRSVNRNGLSTLADGDFLLFLDADALPKTSGFLNRYCNYAMQSSVIVGGTAYRPGYKSDELRVKVGKIKEEITPQVREKNPYGSFSAFNFLIRRDVFCEIYFSEKMLEYGHEDTLFGLELKYRNIDIMHIDNPAYHMGIDSGEDFMEKTTTAVDSLAKLIRAGKIDEDITLFRVYRVLQKSGIHMILRLLHAVAGNSIKKGLAAGYLPLFFFDLYKLLRLSSHSIKIGRRMP